MGRAVATELVRRGRRVRVVNRSVEQAGYVGRRKDDADNRTNLADLTPEGREAAAEVNRLGNEMARTFFGDLTEADAATVVTLLRKAL